MQVFASMIYFILAWVRGPIHLVLRLVSGFFMVALVIVACLFFALPPKQHEATVKLLWVSSIGSFGTFLLQHLYDKLLSKLNVYRLRPLAPKPI
jgi:hypothetical protein